ncbi:MAG TPA: GNAT family N-acetyltransferase [Longimicrobiales bacterium]|nr:GNAT family N-acetyltransferase [Longimicrobiales bacterium]
MSDIELVIEVSEDAAEHDQIRGFVLEKLRAFNRQRAEPPDFQTLSLAVRDDEELVGGLVGETGWKWLFVDLLWIAETHRGRGLGARLLRTAEGEAIRRGVRRAYLDTFDFQARPFYERQGYEVFGTLDDYPPGHSRFFLRKDLV